MTATFHYISICLHISVVVETALSYFRNFQQWEEDHTLATSLIYCATSYRDICGVGQADCVAQKTQQKMDKAVRV